MLSEQQLEAALKILDDRMQAVTQDYLKRMGQHMRALGKLTATDVHRLEQMKRMNANMQAVQQELIRVSQLNMRDVERIFKATAQSDVRFVADLFQREAPSITENKPLARILEAQLRITKQTMRNLSQTTILSDTYRNAVDVGITAVQAGYTDYNSAIRSTIRQAAAEGLRVKYPNSGLTRRLDTAVRQNVLDGVRSINQDVLTQVGKEFGADGVELSAHALCADDHLPYQGRQFSNKEFEEIQSSLKRKIGTWNCKHTFHPILLGISQPAYSDEQLLQFKRNSREEIEIDGKRKTRYEWSQEQRRIETEIRYQKDAAVAAAASGDMQLRREAQARINALSEQYSHISAEAGLIEKRERMSVAGFHPVKLAQPKLPKSPPSGTIPTSPPKPPAPPPKSATRFERSSGALPADYRQALESRFTQGTDNAQKVYDKFVPDGGAVADGAFTGIANFDPKDNQVYMNFVKDNATPTAGKGSTWYHEHGHFVDHNAARLHGLGSYRDFSTRPSFLQAIKADIKAHEQAVKSKYHLRLIKDVRMSVGSELTSSPERTQLTKGIQDIYGGATLKGRYPFTVYGHDAKYYKQWDAIDTALGMHGAQSVVTSEAFANMFDAAFDPAKRAEFQKYLPTAWAEFEKILEDILK